VNYVNKTQAFLTLWQVGEEWLLHQPLSIAGMMKRIVWLICCGQKAFNPNNSFLIEINDVFSQYFNIVFLFF
jgi:hypothetical protein